MTRKFEAKPAELKQVPLLIGLEGPPGGGKTYSALRLARGMQKVRPGPVVLIDTERGRAAKYAREFDFLHVAFEPPFKPTDFLEAVRQQLRLNPAAVIVDSLSDEHEGEGGVIDWHDQEVPRMGGNEHAAWGKPKADRKRMIAGFLQITTPLIFTFRAREKTIQQNKPGSSRKEVVNIGFQPIAPAEIVHALDLVALLPNRADGVPTWRSERAGEDFTIKLPNYLRPFIADGKALDEQMGEAFARWAAGDAPQRPESGPQAASRGSDAPKQPERSEAAPGAPAQPSLRERVSNACLAMAKVNDAGALEALWSGPKLAGIKAAVEQDDELRAILNEAYASKASSFATAPETADEIPY